MDQVDAGEDANAAKAFLPSLGSNPRMLSELPFHLECAVAASFWRAAFSSREYRA
jgi:hypothetical protein